MLNFKKQGTKLYIHDLNFILKKFKKYVPRQSILYTSLIYMNFSYHGLVK